MRKALAHIAAVAITTTSVLSGVQAADPPLELKWAQLMPPAPPKPPRSFLANRPVDLGKLGGLDDGTPAPPPIPEGRWMSIKRRQKSADQPPRVVAELNGKRVKIGGYVVPLDFESTTVKEFLLVPFVGACIHVPPPPVNQIVYVKTKTGLEIKSMFDPVTVTGTIKTEVTFTGLADAGYSIDAEVVEHLKAK